jgi:hypothetical protein
MIVHTKIMDWGGCNVFLVPCWDSRVDDDDDDDIFGVDWWMYVGMYYWLHCE